MQNLRRTVVKIFHGVKGEPNAAYLGTGAIIAPGVVITAKHVLEHPDPHQRINHHHIFLESNFGAFADGGPQSIQPPRVHPEADFALLPLQGQAEADSCAWLAKGELPLATGLDITLIGYGSSGAGAELLDARISNYGGAWNLYLADQSVFSGYSGGPVFYQQRLVGLIVRDDQRRSYVLPITAVRQFIEEHARLADFYRSIRPILDTDVKWIIDLLAGVDIPDDFAEHWFRRVAVNSLFSRAEFGPRLFDQHLDWLSQKKNCAADSPFLVYLCVCRSEGGFDRKLEPSALAQLEQWICNVAERTGISDETLRERIAITREPDPAKEHLVLFIKVEPEGIKVEPEYRMYAWVGKQPLKDFPRNGVAVKDLVDLTKEAIKAARDFMNPSGIAVSLWVEFIFPLELLDWNPNQVRLPGETTIVEQYPVALRSWERHYQWTNPLDEEGPDPDAWRNRCKLLPTYRLMKHHVVPVSDVQSDLQFLKERRDVWALIAPCPHCGIQGSIRKTLLDALHAGLPYILWPTVPALDQPEVRRSIMSWLCNHKHQHYPERMHWTRQNDNRAWRDLALLWDDPSEDLPGTNPLRPPT